VHVAVVGADLMAQARVREAAARIGASVTVHPGPDLPEADVVIVDLEGVAPEALGPVPIGSRALGIYPHKDASLADRARRAGVEPIPRSRFARDLDRLLSGDRNPPSAP